MQQQRRAAIAIFEPVAARPHQQMAKAEKRSAALQVAPFPKPQIIFVSAPRALAIPDVIGIYWFHLGDRIRFPLPHKLAFLYHLMRIPLATSRLVERALRGMTGLIRAQQR
jgi:hypothetical protein